MESEQPARKKRIKWTQKILVFFFLNLVSLVPGWGNKFWFGFDAWTELYQSVDCYGFRKQGFCVLESLP